VIEWNSGLVLYRMERASEKLEDLRILAPAERWNACVNHLFCACFYQNNTRAWSSDVLYQKNVRSERQAWLLCIQRCHF
jgi:hypothetical protein